MKDFDIGLFVDGDKIVTANDFYRFLSKHIEFGSDIYVEVDFSGFGMLHKDIKTREQLSLILYSILYEVSGPDSTIMTPSFSFSWNGKLDNVYDLKSKTHLGVFPNWLLRKQSTLRTIDPIFSVLANGNNAEWYTGYCNDSFGRCSIFKKMHDTNVKLIGIGLKYYDPTFIHYIEQYFDENIQSIKYRYLKEFSGKVVNGGIYNTITKHKSFVRNMSAIGESSYKNLTKDLTDNNLIFCENFLNSKIFISDSNSVFNASIAGLKKNLFYFRKLS
jgi:aminoglycoside N3'-acetyltransferase